MSVLVCGEMLYDVFVEGPTAAGFRLDARIGGSALNVATGLARLGVPAAQLTGVSSDVFGARLLAHMEAEAIDTTHLKRTDAPTTLAIVSPGPDGSASYVFHGEGAADRSIEPADLPGLDRIDAVVFGCFSLLTRPTGDSFLALARRAAATRPGPLVVLDPNVRLAVEPRAAAWRERITAFAASAHLIKTSREDLAAVYDEDPAAVVERWLAEGVEAVVVTDGAAGATLTTRQSHVAVEAPSVNVVDTVGAGDSFLAALIAALFDRRAASAGALAEMDETVLREVLAFATRAAALTCTRRGADLPRRADLGVID